MSGFVNCRQRATAYNTPKKNCNAPGFCNSHGMHWREMRFNKFWTNIGTTNAKVQLQVKSVFCHPEWVLHVTLYPFQSLHTLLTGVRSWLLSDELSSILSNWANSPSLTNMDCTIDKVVVDNHFQHVRILSSNIFFASSYITIHCWAIILLQKSRYVCSSAMYQMSQLLHLEDTLIAVESQFGLDMSGVCQSKKTRMWQQIISASCFYFLLFE